MCPPLMEATDASRLVGVVVVSYQEYSLTRKLGRAFWRERERFLAIPRVEEIFENREQEPEEPSSKKII